MGPCKYSFLKQWFIITYADCSELLFSCKNNHYIQTWMEKHGYKLFKNELDKEGLDKFRFALIESTEIMPDEFEKHFPDEYIRDYTLWNTEKGCYWYSVEDYKKHVKKEMWELLINLQEVIENKGKIEYHIFYNH